MVGCPQDAAATVMPRWFGQAVPSKGRARRRTHARAQVEGEKTYSKLRRESESTGKAARIANDLAESPTSKSRCEGGKSGPNGDCAKHDLDQRGPWRSASRAVLR